MIFKIHLVLTYFNQIEGPSVYLSYPDEKLEEEVINRLLKFFDLDINEPFFEIVLITKKKKIINFNFEIPSQWARGKKEFAMLSLIMKEEYESELVYTFRVTDNGPFKINRDEIDLGRFWGIKEIERNLGKNIFTPNFEQEFTMLQKIIKQKRK